MNTEIDDPDNMPARTASQSRELATPAALPHSEIQLRIARERPRKEKEIAIRVCQELKENPSFADAGFYSIPYKDKRKGIITFVEGLSIRAAEHLWTRWGNCTIGARIADDRGNKIMVQGMFFDYETGVLLLSDLEVSKNGSSRSGGSYPLSEDKLRLAVQSGESKVKRNAFLSGVPVWIKDQYIETCFQLIIASPNAKDKPIEQRLDLATNHFASQYSVSKENVLEMLVKVKQAQPELSPAKLLRYLIGLNAAIKDGNVDPEFIFGEEKKQITMPQSKLETSKTQPDNLEANDAQES